MLKYLFVIKLAEWTQSACLSNTELLSLGFVPTNSTTPDSKNICGATYTKFGQCATSDSVNAFIEECKTEITLSQLTQLSNMVGFFQAQLNSLNNLSLKIQQYTAQNSTNTTARLLKRVSGTESFLEFISTDPSSADSLITPPAENGGDSVRLLQGTQPKVGTITVKRKNSDSTGTMATANVTAPPLPPCNSTTSQCPAANITANGTVSSPIANATAYNSTAGSPPPPTNTSNPPPRNGTGSSPTTTTQATTNGSTQLGSNGTAAQNPAPAPNNGGTTQASATSAASSSAKRNSTSTPPPPPLLDFSDVQSNDRNTTAIKINATTKITVSNVKISQDLINNMAQIQQLVKDSTSFLDGFKRADLRQKLYKAEFQLSAGTACLLTSGNATNMVTKAANGTIIGINVSPSAADYVVSQAIQVISSICQLKRLQVSLAAAIGSTAASTSTGNTTTDICNSADTLKVCVNTFNLCPTDFKNQILTTYFAPFFDKLTLSVDVGLIYNLTQLLNSRVQVQGSAANASKILAPEDASVDPISDANLQPLQRDKQLTIDNDRGLIGLSVFTAGSDVVTIAVSSSIDTSSVESVVADVPSNLVSSASVLAWAVSLILLLKL